MNKKLFFLSMLLFFRFSFAQTYTLIWEENFNGYQIPSGIEGENDSDNLTNSWLYMGDYTSSFTKWTIDASNASMQNFSDYAAVFRTNAYLEPHFRVQDTHGTEIVTPEGGHINWITENITISGHSNVSVTMTIQEEGDHEGSDYIDVYYSVDDGVNYTRINNWNSLGNDDHTFVGDTTFSSDCNSDIDFQEQNIYFAVADNANSLKIKVTFRNGASSENFILDDVKVYGVPTALGVSEDSLSAFTIHPNPSNDYLNIKALNQLETIKIYTTNGQLIYTENQINQKNYTINLSNFSKGIYFVKIINQDLSQSTKKLIVNE